MSWLWEKVLTQEASNQTCQVHSSMREIIIQRNYTPVGTVVISLVGRHISTLMGRLFTKEKNHSPVGTVAEVRSAMLIFVNYLFPWWWTALIWQWQILMYGLHMTNNIPLITKHFVTDPTRELVLTMILHMVDKVHLPTKLIPTVNTGE